MFMVQLLLFAGTALQKEKKQKLAAEHSWA